MGWGEGLKGRDLSGLDCVLIEVTCIKWNLIGTDTGSLTDRHDADGLRGGERDRGGREESRGGGGVRRGGAAAPRHFICRHRTLRGYFTISCPPCHHELLASLLLTLATPQDAWAGEEF